jgi:hypothetical protein
MAAYGKCAGLSNEIENGARWRDVLLYFLIAVVLVGSEVVVLVRNPDTHISNRIVSSVATGLIIAIYLIKSFKTKLGLVRFWILFLGLLAIHFLWTPLVPMLFTIVGMRRVPCICNSHRPSLR